MTTSAVSRIAARLRSPRLAIVLIGALTAYSILATLVPRGAPTDAAVGAWVRAHPLAEALAGPLGMHRAYSSPLFVVLAGLLAVSTALCAAQRTRYASRVFRSMGRPTGEMIERLRTAAPIAVEVAKDVTLEDALEEVSRGLRGAGLRTRVSGPLLEGRAGVIGAVGSPLFHWSIVALIAVAALGQLTRSEGFIGLPVGDRVAEVHDSYLQVSEGPLFGERHTGVELEAIDVPRHYRVDGIDVGSAPRIRASADGSEIAVGRVYPNSPLRVGSLLVHNADFGPAVTVAAETSQGAEVVRRTLLLDRSATTTSGTAPKDLVIGARGSSPVVVSVEAVTRALRTPAAPSRAVFETASGPGRGRQRATVDVGDFLTLPGGTRLRLVEVKDWVRVSVVNDWSVPFVYALITLGAVGLAISVLFRVRQVLVVAVEAPGGWSLNARTRHPRPDPAFDLRVAAILESAAVGRGDDESVR